MKHNSILQQQEKERELIKLTTYFKFKIKYAADIHHRGKVCSSVKNDLEREFVNSKQKLTHSGGLSTLTHSSWRDLRMAGMLVAEGAFGRIGCDTTKDSKVPHIDNKLSLSLITLVLYINSKCSWFRLGGHNVL